jgi:hypothetical protein
MKWIYCFAFLLGSSQTWAQAPIEILKIDPHSHFACAAAAAFSESPDPDPWGSCLLIAYKNISQRKISGVRFSVNFVTAMKEVTPLTFHSEDTRELGPGKKLTLLTHDGVFWDQYGGDKMGANVAIEKIMFADGTFWTPPLPASMSEATPDATPDASAELLTARSDFTQQLNAQIRKTGGSGYSEIKDNVLIIHSERADETRFQAINVLIRRLRILKIVRVVYTNDAEKIFTLDVSTS